MAAWRELGGVWGGLGWAGEKHLDRGGGSKGINVRWRGEGESIHGGEGITEWQPFPRATIKFACGGRFLSSPAGMGWTTKEGVTKRRAEHMGGQIGESYFLFK